MKYQFAYISHLFFFCRVSTYGTEQQVRFYYLCHWDLDPNLPYAHLIISKIIPSETPS